MSNKTSAKLGAVFAATLFTASFTSSASASFNFSKMVSFGDSLSDTGNVYYATNCHIDSSIASGCAAGQVNETWAPNQFYSGGGFQDGPSWNQSMAAQLGIASPQPLALGGTNYAFGGARATDTPYMNSGMADGSVPSVEEQVGMYLSSTNGVADPNAIYTIFAGGNDIQGVAAVEWGPSEVFAAASYVEILTQQLIDAGAESILVANVPNVGLAPIVALGSTPPSVATGLTMAYNATFANIGSNPEVVLVDTFTTSNAIAADTAAGATQYGFTNLNGSCAMDTESGVNTSGNCDNYLFYDLLHPTAAANSVIAADALAGAIQLRNNRAAVVPVPAAAWLFMSGLAGLVGLRKARK